MEKKNKKQFFIRRLFIALMIPIVLSLSILPCCPPSESCVDEVGSCADEPVQGAFPGSGLCSPFFTCGHCPGIILQQVEFPALTFQEINGTISGIRSEFKPFILVKSFFKPPKA
ncbi:hypothetical protein [uncultured Cyclobacterium sp.]|uniref:hypothetical protein n=1 Tax=uncultured Cyclobacterium sp. TaxID=453820 RepID=UPI0030ED5755|tara:strand:+ start:1080 stop:1421 length:342 start_codon:yes stop_codon:yes gene_type:complete